MYGKSSTIKKKSLFRTVKQHDVELPQNIVFNNFEEKKNLYQCAQNDWKPGLTSTV